MDDSLIDRIRARGWRMTPQRRAIADALDGDHVHLTAVEIHSRAIAVLPEVSLATVYNTLNELVAVGEVAEVRYADGPVRYDPNVGPHPHHHLMCTQCGTMFDVQPRGVVDIELPSEQRRGFAVERIDVLFRGVCSSCQAG